MKAKVLSSSFLLVFATFLQPALSFLLLPIYLKYFPVEDYGIYTVMNTISYLVGIIAAARIYAAIHPYYYDYNYSKQRINEYIGNILGFTIISDVILIVLAILFGQLVFNTIFSNDISFFPYGFYAVVIGLSQSLMLPYCILLMHKKEIPTYTLIQVIFVVLTVGLQVVFIIILNKGIEGALFARAIASIFVATIPLALYYKHITFRFKKIYIYRSLQFSLPLIPFSFLEWFGRFGDRFFMENLFSLKMLGIYSFLTTIALLILMVNEALIGAIQPFLYEIYNKKEDPERHINLLFKFYIFSILIFSSVIITITAHLHLFLENENFLKVLKYIPLAAFLYFLISYYNFFKTSLLFKKESKLLSTLSIVHVVIIITAYMIFIPPLQIWGALISNIIGYVFLGISTYLFYTRNINLPLDKVKMILLPLLILLFVAFIMGNDIVGLSASEKSILQLLFVVVCTACLLRNNLISILQLVTKRLKSYVNH